ncbi:MAG: hypothetical protein ACLQBK_13920 [Candidatus Sulfotelmatobacter sp.]
MAWLLCLGTALWAQDTEAPNPSLGDVARQNRAQHAASEGPDSKAQAMAEEMQHEEEASEAAPTGFKSYDAGDYRLFVPFPFSLEGRDNGGPVLVGSRLGVTNTEVLAGTPIPLPANISDSDLMNGVRQLAGLHGAYPSCSAAKLGSHKAFHCSWNGSPYLLGHQVWGTMEIVVGSNSLIPVMCVSPDEFQCLTQDRWGYHTCNNPNPSWQEVQQTRAAIDTRFRDEKTTGQMCEQIIYPSIQLKEDIVVHPASIGESKTAPATAPTTTEPVPGPVIAGQAGPPGPSLAELARQTRQAPRAKAQATLDNGEGRTAAPQGFQSFAVQYCHNPQQCFEASVIIPEKAEVISRVNGQHIFKTMLNGDPVMLYAGPADVNAPYRSLTSPDFIRMRDLANSNGWSHEKTDGVSTQELTIEGRPALMTRFRYQRDENIWWIGERALIEDRDMQFLVGCTAPEQRFADAEALCTTLVNSLRLP